MMAHLPKAESIGIQACFPLIFVGCLTKASAKTTSWKSFQKGVWYTWFSGCISSTCKTNTWEVHDLTKPVLHHQNEHVLWNKDPYFFAWIFHLPTIFQPINFLPHLHGCKAHRHPKAATWPRWSGGKTHLGVMCLAGWTALGMYPGGDHHYMTPNPKNAQKEGKSHKITYHTCFVFDLILPLCGFSEYCQQSLLCESFKLEWAKNPKEIKTTNRS